MARRSADPIEKESGAGGMALLLVALPLAALTTVTVGAVCVDRVGLPLVAALAVGALSALAIPLAFDRALTGAYRRIDPAAKSVAAQATLFWNVAVLVALAALASSTTGRALQAHGDWLFPRAQGSVPDALRRGFHAAGERLAGDVLDAAVRDAAAPVDAADAATDRGARPDVVDDAPIPTDRDLTPQEIFRLRADAVVVVAARARADSATPLAQMTGIRAPVSSGSGFIVDADGLIVTNEHVIHGAVSVRVALRDDREFTPVTLLAVDRSHDLALLRIEGRGLPVAPVSQDDVIAVGTHATAIGSPLGLSYTLTDGLVSASREVEGTTFLQIDTAIAAGSSGGPLFDPRGRVIGVTTATAGAAGMNLALHPKYIRALLARARTPRVLEAFASEVRVTGLELDGAEASPVERMNLDETVRLLAAGIESCAAQARSATFLTVRSTLERLGARGRARRGPREVVQSDLGAAGEACLATNIRLTGVRLSMQLQREHGDEVAAGGSLTVRFTARFGRASSDAGARGINVRYEFEAPDDDDNDAGDEE